MTVNSVEQDEANRWPDLAAPQYTPFRAWVAERLFRLALRNQPVRAVFPDGTYIGAGGPASPVLNVIRPDDFFTRLGVDTKIGFGEAYMAGDWDSDDLVAVLTPLAARMASLVPKPLQALRPWVDPGKPESEKNTPTGARANVRKHYDLSNDMFAAFLDATMTYSSAWFGPDDDLQSAQLRKIDGMLDYAGVGAGSTMLEIGTGWGALAQRAAERGAKVTTLTISAEQRDLAEKRLADAGVADRVRVMLRDYRDAEGSYDAVVSVEMIEAVGEPYWPTYFRTLDRLLKPGGRASLQAITMPHDRLIATRHSYTWIHKYVFPGGQLLSIPAIEQSVREHTGLQFGERRSLGLDYARTLAEWRTRFLDAWDTVSALGFDEAFRRLWEFYLSYCEAGFRARYLDVWQLQLHKGHS